MTSSGDLQSDGLSRGPGKMRKIKEEFIEKLIDKADIYDVVSKRIKLKKNGKTYWGLCPFHKEVTPSFCIDTEKQFFHCFGCGAHGSALSFIMKHDKLDLEDAVIVLAKECGMAVEYETTEDTPEEPKNYFGDYASFIDAVTRRDRVIVVENFEKATFLYVNGIEEVYSLNNKIEILDLIDLLELTNNFYFVLDDKESNQEYIDSLIKDLLVIKQSDNNFRILLLPPTHWLTNSTTEKQVQDYGIEYLFVMLGFSESIEKYLIKKLCKDKDLTKVEDQKALVKEATPYIQAALPNTAFRSKIIKKISELSGQGSPFQLLDFYEK